MSDGPVHVCMFLKVCIISPKPDEIHNAIGLAQRNHNNIILALSSNKNIISMRDDNMWSYIY